MTEKKMNNELKTVEPKQDQMLAMIEKVAFDPNVDVAKMEKLLDMQERIFDKQTTIDFNKAMVSCQKEMPIVVAKVSNDQTRSKYAKVEHILQSIKPTYVKHGFSMSFGTDKSQLKDHIIVTCDVMHESGYSRQYMSEMPMDSTGIKGSVNKTAVHATASAYTYAKRYLIGMIFNLTIADEDDDGVKAGGVTIEKLLDYNFELRKHWATIAAVKQAIYDDELSTAVEAFIELDRKDQISLWLAPTKGGIFTTKEREIMKGDEWGAEVRSQIGNKQDEFVAGMES